MSIKLDKSESIDSYKDDLEKSLSSIETELNSISISLNVISKTQLNKIQNLFTECDNNVNKIKIIYKLYISIYYYR